jgi:hypothetical protein
MLANISINTKSTFGDLSPDNESLPTDHLLASGSLVPYQTGNTSSTTLSTISYLSAGDYINFGMFSTNASLTKRTTASITLVQQNA